MLLVKYASDAERKRLEYLLEKWRGTLRFEKPSGAVLLIDARTEQLMKFVEELYSRIPRERVSLYRLEEAEFQLEPLTLEGVVRSGMGVNELWGAVNLVLAKLRGVLVSETRGEKVYVISSRKGVCKVRVSIAPRNGESLLRFAVEGFGEAVVHIYDRLAQELSYIGEVERHG